MGSGDIMVLCSACMYAFSNVLQEKLIERGCTVKEALDILGAFGTLFSVMQTCSLEWRRFVDVTKTSLMALHTLGFQMRLFGMHVLTSFFISVGDAENLSLLTSDTYGVAWVDVQSIVEPILVMKLPTEQTRRLSWRLGLASALMVAHGYLARFRTICSCVGSGGPWPWSRSASWQCATRPLWCQVTITSLRTCSCQGRG